MLGDSRRLQGASFGNVSGLRGFGVSASGFQGSGNLGSVL